MKSLQEVVDEHGRVDVTVVRVAISYEDALRLYEACCGEAELNLSEFMDRSARGDTIELNAARRVRLVTPGLPDFFTESAHYWVEAEDVQWLVDWISLYGICLRWIHGISREATPPGSSLPKIYSYTDTVTGGGLEAWAEPGAPAVRTIEVEAATLPEYLELRTLGYDKCLAA